MENISSKLNVPHELLENLRCAVCTKYLSIFPVSTSTSLESICGRCPTENVDNATRNILYEKFVEVFRFPCSNSMYGCTEYFLPLEMAIHEQTCKYRHVKCPSFQHLNCEWIGPCTQLQDHYEMTHPIFLMKQLDFEINFINTFDENFLLLYGDEIFIFRRQADAKDGTLCCSVLYFGWNSRSDDFNYQIKLTSRSNNRQKMFEKYSTTGLDENITKMVAKEVNECLNNPSVIVGTIEVTLKQDLTENNIPKPEKSNVCEMLETIECPICFEFMVPPIFQCLGGHSICGTCKDTVPHCPTCRGAIKNTRNIILEKMISYLPYPCKNRENGCTVITEAVSIKKHEKYCEYGSFDCPLKDYEGCNHTSKFSDITKHLETNHHDNIMELDTVHIPFDGSYDDEYGLIFKHVGKLFIMHFKINAHELWWSFQFIGAPENSKKYVCEVDLIDNTLGKNRLYMKGPVGTLTSKDSCFKQMPYFKLSLQQIQHFITDTFSFQARVFKD